MPLLIKTQAVVEMSSEEIVKQILDFVYEKGRLPKHGEPGFEDVINAAVKTFGSLENALRIAGLLTQAVETRRTRGSRRPSPKRAQALKSSYSQYSRDYFLTLLNLKRRNHHGSPAPDGTPSWWERRSNKQYTCSSCKEIIEKGKRYIGRKKLHPGMRGIYGYRGTYATDYYHITCLLRSEKTQTEKRIRNTRFKIGSIEKEILDYEEQITSNKGQINVRQKRVQQVREDYELASSWKKVGKWFVSHYTSWSRNREIRRLEKEITYIQNVEIPERDTKIANLKRKINSLSKRSSELETRLQELRAFQLK